MTQESSPANIITFSRESPEARRRREHNAKLSGKIRQDIEYFTPEPAADNLASHPEIQRLSTQHARRTHNTGALERLKITPKFNAGKAEVVQLKKSE